LKYIQKVIKLA